jgi:hypothetical protein
MPKKAERCKFMRKTIFLLIAIATMLLLVSCTPNNEVSKTPDVSTDVSTEDTSKEPDVSDTDISEPDVSEPEVSEPDVSEPEVSEPDVSEPEVSEPDVSEPEVVILDYTSNFGGQKLVAISGNEADRANPFRFYGTWNLKRADDGTYDLVVKVLLDCSRLQMGPRTIYVTIDGKKYEIDSKAIDVKRDSDAVRYLVVTLGQVQTKVELDENGAFSADVSVRMEYNGTYSDVEIKTLEFSETITINK